MNSVGLTATQLGRQECVCPKHKLLIRDRTDLFTNSVYAHTLSGIQINRRRYPVYALTLVDQTLI